MFIKITKSRGIEYLNIAEGYRENGKVKHRNIAALGRLDSLLDSGSLENIALKLLSLASAPLLLPPFQRTSVRANCSTTVTSLTNISGII